MTQGGLAFPIVQGILIGNERFASGKVEAELFSPVILQCPGPVIVLSM